MIKFYFCITIFNLNNKNSDEQKQCHSVLTKGPRVEEEQDESESE